MYIQPSHWHCLHRPISVEQTAWRLLLGTRKSVPRILIASKTAFLGNYLAVSVWILNGSSIECHEKKRQPFSLSGVQFGSRAILISGWKSASRSSGQKWPFHPCLLLITYNNSQQQNPPNRSNSPFRTMYNVQYRSKVSWQSLEPRDSILDSFKYRVSSLEDRVSSLKYQVASQKS